MNAFFGKISNNFNLQKNYFLYDLNTLKQQLGIYPAVKFWLSTCITRPMVSQRSEYINCRNRNNNNITENNSFHFLNQNFAHIFYFVLSFDPAFTSSIIQVWSFLCPKDGCRRRPNFSRLFVHPTHHEINFPLGELDFVLDFYLSRLF